MSSHPTHPPGALIGGKFRIIRQLGVGGFGVVYEVQHELTRHRRALKLLHPEVREKYPHLVQRFLREASVAGTIGDAHIVETFDAGELPTGEPYLVMELLHGEPLSARIARGGLPIRDAIAIAVQLCEGVAMAHSRGIVHRDLKPDNVFLCTGMTLRGSRTRIGTGSPDDPPFVKILDFGISKFAASDGTNVMQTQEGTAIGTPMYMPPEQVRGLKDIDGRADVYALGVLLYEMLAGRPPFVGESLPQLSILIHEGNATPVKLLRSDVPDELAAVVADAMAVEREKRIQSAAALGERLAPMVGAVFPDVPLPPARIALAPTMPGDENAKTLPSGEGAITSHGSAIESIQLRPAMRSRSLPIAIVTVLLLIGATIVFASRSPTRTPSTSPTATPPAIPLPVAVTVSENPTIEPAAPSVSASASAPTPPVSASGKPVAAKPSAIKSAASVPKPPSLTENPFQ